MKIPAALLAWLAWLALLPAGARADEALPKVVIPAARDAEWHSYRHAYKAARFFAPFVKARPLIQAHMQIRPNRPDLPLDGLEVQLAGESVNMALPVDAIGRLEIPLLKQAFDEDAVLRLNRQKGHYHFSGRYSIREREDGVYGGAMLRAACDQLLSAQRESGYRLRLVGKKCAGVKFIYPATGPAPEVLHKDAAGALAQLPVERGHPFENATMGNYQVAVYRFAAWSAQGEVLARGKPLAVGTLYE